jgi:xanthine dehydrogenase accessory factor
MLRLAMREILEAAVKLAEAGEAVALVTIVSTEGSTPRKAGARMLVRGDGRLQGTVGGGRLEADLVQRAREALATGRPELVSFDLTGEGEGGLVCGGTVRAFVEPIEAAPTLLLFGAGHVSAALARLARPLGFRVEVADDRPEQASRERFPEADRLVNDGFEGAAAQMSLGPNAYAVVATRGFDGDLAALASLVGRGLRFIGVLGSRTKAAKLQEALRERNVPDEEIARIRSPLGLSIGAQTPEEIAVSIVAELVAVRRATPDLK